MANNTVYPNTVNCQSKLKAKSHIQSHTGTQAQGAVPHVNLGFGALSLLGLLVQPLGQVLDVGIHLDHPEGFG